MGTWEVSALTRACFPTKYTVRCKVAHINQVEYNRRWRAKNTIQFKKKQLGYHYLKTYGITQEQYDELFVKQKGKCKICGRHQLTLKARLAVDHNHETGKVRSLLCTNCNSAIGLVSEDITVLKKMIKYIKIYKEN